MSPHGFSPLMGASYYGIATWEAFSLVFRALPAVAMGCYGLLGVAMQKGIKDRGSWSVIGQQNFLVLQFEACDVDILS